ncbi:hypothetical protein ADEAN_000297000 [Angomonas deanei]|uniref:Uncharacterized protein n=1 Tax=Angomonas deanei TaxID=59799 RepID=A0A7G2C7U3_9TRYP|nr:hypothetical protein ADEAN_000297000 [Angomonas deanei]
MPLLSALRSKELRSVTHLLYMTGAVKDRRTRVHESKPNRRSFLYRRDKAMFDKYHVTARHVAPGFSEGALANDTRGLGFYTPDHPQVPFKKLPFYDAHLKKYDTD